MTRGTNFLYSLITLFLVLSGDVFAGTIYNTGSATNIKVQSVTLNGVVASTGSVNNFKFNYGPTNAYGANVSTNPGSNASASQPVTAAVTGLNCNTTYHYQLVGSIYQTTILGSDATFTTTPISEPTNVIATAGDGQASISWTAPSTNCGSPITNYTVTSNDVTKTCSTSGTTSCSVTGLTNGNAYTFTVQATSSLGTGDVSGSSNSVTPFVTTNSTPNNSVNAPVSPFALLAIFFGIGAIGKRMSVKRHP